MHIYVHKVYRSVFKCGGGDSFSYCVGLKPRKNNKLNTKQEK